MCVFGIFFPMCVGLGFLARSFPIRFPIRFHVSCLDISVLSNFLVLGRCRLDFTRFDSIDFIRKRRVCSSSEPLLNCYRASVPSIPT